MQKKIKETGSSVIALFPSFKCEEGELTILSAMISVYHESKAVEGITVSYDSPGGVYSMETINEAATDDNAALWIETGTIISLCDIVGRDYWNSLDDDQRVAVGPCVLKMIEENLLKADFSADDSDDMDASVKSKKVTRKK